MMFAKMVILSIKRRKREIGLVSIVTFIAVLFLAGVSLFQNVMNRYLMESNYKNYGEWVLASLNKELSHPYFASTGSCKTGAVVLNEQGDVIGESIGCVDDGFLGLANLTFYEGRLPEKDDEIIMNLTTLAKLGYSLDLGQKIHIRIQTETAVLEKDFTLVGTMKDFSNTWKYVDEYPLPSCVMTVDALNELGGSLYTTHFYQLDRIYEGIDKEELKNGFIEPGAVVFNEYVYNNVVWGSQEMFADMQDFLILITLLMLIYLMMSYVAKRRSWYYKLRCTGAGKRQIWAMVFVEGLYGTLPWAVLGFVVPHAAGMLICNWVSAREQLPNIFEVDIEGLVSQIVTVVGVILLALFVACLWTGDKRLSNNVSEITNGQLRRLKWAARGKKNVAKQFVKRQEICHSWQGIAMKLCACIVSTILITCMFMIMWKYDYYQLLTDNINDFQAYKGYVGDGPTYTVLEEGTDGETVEKEVLFSENVLYYGFDYGVNKQLEKELDAIEGIAKTDMFSLELESCLDWEGKENSQPYLFQYEDSKRENFVSEEETWRHVEDVMMYRLQIDTYEDLKEKYSIIFEHANLDEEAFIKGEQIIVFYPKTETSRVNELGEFEDGIILEETTLKDGMNAVWKNAQMGVELPIVVCMPELTEEQLEEAVISPNVYSIYASEGFAERVAAELGTQMEYNTLSIDFEPNTVFGSTSKRLAATLVAHEFNYELFWEMKAMAREEFYNALCVYGTLFCMICVSYLALQMNVNQMKHYNRGRQYLQLKRLGMRDAFFMWMHIKQGIKDALWLFSGVLTGYAIYFVVREPLLLHPTENASLIVESAFTGEYTSEPFWVLLQYMIDEFQFESFAIIFASVLLMIMLLTIIVAGTARKSMLKEGKES